MLVSPAPLPCSARFGAARHLLWRLVLLVVLAPWAGGCASVPAQVPRTASHALATPQDTALGQLVQARREPANLVNSPAVASPDWFLDKAYADTLALIEAKHITGD